MVPASSYGDGEAHKILRALQSLKAEAMYWHEPASPMTLGKLVQSLILPDFLACRNSGCLRRNRGAGFPHSSTNESFYEIWLAQ